MCCKFYDSLDLNRSNFYFMGPADSSNNEVQSRKRTVPKRFYHGYSVSGVTFQNLLGYFQINLFITGSFHV